MTFMVSWWTVTALAMAAGPLSSVPPEILDWEPSENREIFVTIEQFVFL